MVARLQNWKSPQRIRSARVTEHYYTFCQENICCKLLHICNINKRTSQMQFVYFLLHFHNVLKYLATNRWLKHIAKPRFELLQCPGVCNQKCQRVFASGSFLLFFKPIVGTPNFPITDHIQWFDTQMQTTDRTLTHKSKELMTGDQCTINQRPCWWSFANSRFIKF